MSSKVQNKSLAEEKSDIQRAMKASFQEGAIWQPIALSWFEKWKTYVNYDDEVPEPRDKEIVDSLHPGELDNSSLQGSFGDEMRRDAVEGRDFVLLPSQSANMLFEKYGGGPSFPRKVLNVGQYYNPIYQVNLWPIRIEVYICDRNQPTPIQSDDKFKRRYFNKNMRLDDVADDLGRLFNIHRSSSSTRFWLRDTPPDTSAEEKKGTGRMLTCDVVDFDGDWRFVRSDASRSIQEVLGERDCIELIIEVAGSRMPRDVDWPRFRQLEAWKKELRVGDMVDVKDRKGKFYAARILEIDEAKNLLVHFFGWGETNDEKILAADINARVAPLHGHSFDRSKWEEGNKVDVFLTDLSPGSNTSAWAVGTIIGTDPKTDRVEVMVEAKDKADAVKRKANTTASTTTSSSTSMVSKRMTGDNDDDDEIDDFSVHDDDALKKKVAAAAKSSTDSLSAGMEDVMNTTTSADAPKKADETLRLWVDVYGDNVAPQNMHTPALRSASTAYGSSSGGNSGGYGLSSMYNTYSNISYDRHTKGNPPVAGAVGLQNLGNTCFMNSILQCLSNTQPLTQIFTSGVYRDQINYDNPLGHSGKIALTYGKLIKDMWSGAYTKVVPREFKTVIGDYRPQFAGYEQQDSQEMMGCLLDGLHEDLNRIKKKPYTQKIESKGRSDELIASESWRRFLLRNDSLIVESFFGMQKSHVTCRNCGKESVTFDPYTTLSVPIPVRNVRTVSVIVQLLPCTTYPVRLALEVELTATMSDMKRLLIDKLVELQLVSAPHATTPTPTTTTGSGNSNSNENNSTTAVSTSTDESYELVQKEDATTTADSPMLVDQDDTVVVESKMAVQEDTTAASGKRHLNNNHDDNDNNNSSNSNNTTNEKAMQQKALYDSLHFHFGVLYSTRTTTVAKNYNSQDMKNTAITAFVGKLDYLVAFQLEHPLAEFKNTSTSSSSYYYSSMTSSSSKKKTSLLDNDNSNNNDGLTAEEIALRKQEAAYGGMDIVVGSREGMRIDLIGCPRRVSFVKETTTNADIHRLVRQMLKRTIPKTATTLWNQDETAWPYELVVTSSYGSQVYRTVEKSDAVFTPLKDNLEILVVYWHNALVKDGVVDLRQAKEIIEQSSFNNNNGNNNNSGVVPPLPPAASSSNRFDEDDEDDEDEYFPHHRHVTPSSSSYSSNNNNNNSSQPLQKRAKKTMTIYDCLDKYIEREQLADTETVYCNRCKEMLAPIKKMDIWTAPDILILHLKRFQFITGQYMVLREKINDVIDFPIEGLDLSRYVQSRGSAASTEAMASAPPVYDLFAVSHHMGNLGGGHYTATAKNFLNNQWYYFNDSSVTPTDPTSAVNATAYVLFYKRRSGTLKWAGQMPHPEGLPDEEDD